MSETMEKLKLIFVKIEDKGDPEEIQKRMKSKKLVEFDLWLEHQIPKSWKNCGWQLVYVTGTMCV